MDYKRILAVGDIHGMYDKLIALIEQVQFSPVEDLLIFLGDYIDRGPQSLECLDYVMNLQQQYPERVVCLKGNHEALCVNYYWFKADKIGFILAGKDLQAALMWSGNGGKETKKQFTKLKKPELQARLSWMRKLPNCYQIEDFYFCHAGIAPKVSLREQREQDLLWIRDEFFDWYDGCDGTIVVGHTPVQYWYCQEGELPNTPQFKKNHIIMCDTGAYMDGMPLNSRIVSGKLSCVDVLSKMFWQA